LDEPVHEIGWAPRPAERLGRRPEPRGPARRQGRGPPDAPGRPPAGGGRRARLGARLLVVAADRRVEASRRPAADLHGDRRRAEETPGTGPDLVDEPGSPRRHGGQLDEDPHLRDRPLGVAADHAEAAGPDPLEGLLLPLDGNAETGQPEATPRAREVLTVPGH